MKIEKILLTGSSGMVGKNIVDLKPSSINLFSPQLDELDLLNYNEVCRFIKITDPSCVIHAAGIVGGIQANIKNPVKFLRDNTLMAHNIIWAAQENKVPYFLNLGSSCMYPKNAVNPLKEDMILEGSLEPTNEGYALAKIFAQRFCSYINSEENNKNYKTLIPCNLYGKYDKFDPEWGHMIPSVIRKIHHAKTAGNSEVSIWGDGTARREFMFSEDLADFIWYTIKNIDLVPEVINVGLGFDYTINEYYQKIAEVVDYQGSFKHDLSKPVGMKQKLVDNHILSIIGWEPKTTLQKGLEATYKYFLEKY